MFNMSSDDSNSTQLEGKKLKNRGARIAGGNGWFKESPQLEIDKDAPGLMEEVEIEEGQEYFTDRELGKENKKERDERLKREMAVARRQQQEIQKQQQREVNVNENTRTPNERLGEIEQGMLQSRNKGPTISTKFKEQNKPADELQAEHHAQHRKTDVPIVSALIGGENAKNMAEHKPEDKSIAAKLLPDIRGGGKESGLGF